MIELITNLPPSVRMEHVPPPGNEWRVTFGPEDKYGIVVKSEPKIEECRVSERLYFFGVDVQQANEMRDYIITDIIKNNRLPNHFPYEIKWEDRAMGIQSITFLWWKVTIV